MGRKKREEITAQDVKDIWESGSKTNTESRTSSETRRETNSSNGTFESPGITAQDVKNIWEKHSQPSTKTQTSTTSTYQGSRVRTTPNNGKFASHINTAGTDNKNTVPIRGYQSPFKTSQQRLAEEITNKNILKTKAIKDEYESYNPKDHAFPKNILDWGLTTAAKRNNLEIPERFKSALEYERHQELAPQYAEIKKNEAMHDLINRGFTEQDFWYLSHPYLTDEEKDDLRRQGKKEWEIAAIEKDQNAKANEVSNRLYEATFHPGEGLRPSDYMDMTYDRYTREARIRDAQSNPAGASALSLLLNPLESTVNVLRQTGNFLTGNAIPRHESITDLMRSGVAETIDSNLGKTAYMGGMSIGDMAVAAGAAYATGGGSIISAGIQALEKASQTLDDATARNLNPVQIMLEGIASGITTYLTESIPMGMLEDIAENGLTEYTAKEIGKKLAAQMAAEGLQEGAEDIADYIADAIIAGDKAEFNNMVREYMEQGLSEREAISRAVADRSKEVVTDMVVGGIGGAVMGGAGVGLGYMAGNAKTDSVQTDIVLQSDQAINQLIEAVQSIDTTKLSTEDAERVEHAIEVSKKDANALTVEDVVDMANVVNEQAGPNNKLSQAIKEINYQANIDNNIRQYEETGKIEKRVDETPIEEAARLRTGSIIENEYKQAEKIQAQLDKAMLNKAAEYFENDAAAKNFLENYNGQNRRMYTETSYLAYNAGESGQSFQTFLDNTPNARYMISQNIVSEDYLKTLYYNGQNSRTIGKQRTSVRINENRGRVTGIKSEINDFQEGVARKLNAEIYNDPNKTIERGKFLANSVKIILSDTADNQYQTLIHEMFEYARVYNPEGMDLAERTLVKMIVDKSGERSFVDAVNRYKEAYKEAARRNPNSDVASEANKTFADAQEEFINDAISYIFSTDEGAKNIVDYVMNDGTTTAEQKVSTLEAIKSWVDHLIQSIKNYLSGHKTEQLGYKRAESLKMTSEELEKLSRMLIGALEGARANLEAITESGEVSEETAHSLDVIEDMKEDNIAFNGDNDVRFSIATYDPHILKEYLEKYSGLTKKDQKDIVETLDWGFKIAKEMDENGEYESFSSWSRTKLEVDAQGRPLLEVFDEDGKPIRSVVVNNGEYPLNIDFSQVCKKRIALNSVLNKLISDADLNLAILTESDIAGINRLIKEHQFEIACGLCFVDAKRYRVGTWADSFVNGKSNKKTHKKTKLGWNDLVNSMIPKGASAQYFNVASDHVVPLGTLLDTLSDDQVDFTTIDKVIKPFLKEDGTIGQRIVNGKAKNPTEQVRMAYLLKTDPTARMLLDSNDIIASEGLDTLRVKYPQVYKLVNAHEGTAKPKLSHGFTAYGNEILRAKDWKGKKNQFIKENAYAVGGVRVQSFSDYVANLFFDYMQMFADMSARALPSHAYSKESTYVRLFGMTGQRINMSLIFKGANLTQEQSDRLAKLFKKGGRKAVLADEEFGKLCERAGLDENGNYIFEDESFDFEEALKIQNDPRYKNCGTIGVGLSDAHILKMLNDDDIKMVIPYHASGVSPIIKQARNLVLYTDYTGSQNTRGRDGKKIEGGDGFDWYGLLKSEINPKGLDAKGVADAYLKYCDKHKYIPKFEDSLTSRKFRDNPNYYKLLIDFRAYDNEGKFMPQGPVKMVFPEESEFKKLVSESLKAQQETEDRLEKELTNEQKTLYTEVKGFLKEQGTLEERDNAELSEELSTRYSIEVTDPKTIDFLENQDHIKTYRAFQLIDGKLYAPMAALDYHYDEKGKKVKRLGYSSQLGKWEMATEAKDVAKANMEKGKKKVGKDGREYAQFDLEGGDNQTGGVAYNPYLHSSNVVLNDQFTAAFRRNLVVAECEVPISEADGAYWADMAKDATGWHDWKAGTVAGKIAKEKSGFKRQVFLSRYMKIKRILPNSEVAQMYKEYLDGTDVSVPWNVVTDGLRDELVKAGVKVDFKNASNDSVGTYEAWKSSDNVKHSISVVDSEGNELTKEQQKYFADSKVRDENGNLLRVFHGSGANFNIFDLGQARDSEDIEAFFFSANQEEAEGYGNTREFYLNITNPADYDTAYNIFFEERKNKAEGAGARTRERLQKMGYDGVIAYDESSPEYTEYLVFSPEQIKLVSNKKPTSNEDIRYSIDVPAENVENHDYSYDTLTNKEPLICYNSDKSEIKLDRVVYKRGDSPSDIVTATRKNIERYNEDKGNNLGDNKLYNRDLARVVNISNEGIKHVKRDHTQNHTDAVTNLPMYFENSIVLNETDGKRNGADSAYLLFGRYEDSKGIHITRVLVNHYNKEGDKAEEISDYVYSISKKTAKTRFESALTTNQPSSSVSEISIADFLDEVKWAYPNDLSSDVANHLGLNRRGPRLEGIRYSIAVTEDSEGRELSEGQQKYFAKSLVRDSKGRLKIMYHGTPGAGFTIFENADDGISFFFTDKKSVAEGYSGVDYLNNPDTPMTIDEINESMWNICGSSDEDHLFKEVNGKIEYWDLNEGELSKEKTFNSLREAQNWFVDEYVSPLVYQDRAYPSNYQVYLKAENPFVYDANGKEWNDLEPVEYKRHFSDLEIVPVGNNFEVDYQENGAYYHKIYTEEELDNIFGDGTGTMAKISYDSQGQYYVANVYLDENNKKIFSNTRELARYAKDNGYDSLIINDVVDSGGYNLGSTESSQVVVVFNSNQIKSIYNMNPTEDADIRYSIDVPFFDAFEEIDNQVNLDEKDLQKLVSQIDDLDSEVSQKAVNDIASRIKKEYNSKIDKKRLANDIMSVFRYLKSTGKMSMDDVMFVMSDIARPVLEQMESADKDQERLYKAFIDKVKGYKIALDAGQTQEVANAYGSYYNFMNAMRGKLTLSKEGTPLDNIWTEICDVSDGALSYGTNPNDQPLALAEYINSLNPTGQALEGQNLDSAATDLALEIFRQFYVYQSMADAAEKVQGEITKRANKAKEEYKKKYNEAVKQVEREKALNIERLSKEIDNLTAEEQEALRNGDAINQAVIKNIREDYRRRLDKLRAESNHKIIQIKAQYQNSRIERNLRSERSALKNRVLREVKALQNMIAHPAEGSSKHVPINLIKPTIEMLEAINLDNGGRNKAIAERLKKMSEVYEAFKNDDTYSFDYDQRIADDIKELQKMFENKSYADLGIMDLQRVIEIVTALKTQIKNANNLILQDKLKDAKAAASDAINEVKGSRRHDNAAMNALNRYGNLHLNAYREFRKLAGYMDGSIMDIYNDLDEGSKREMQIQKDLGAIFQDVLEGQKNQKEVKKFISTKPEDLVDIGITDKNGKPIKITRAMRMSLIMHSMNASNMRHVLGSGITIPNMYYFAKGKMDEAYAKGTNYRFVDYTELLDAIQRNDQAKIAELTRQAQERVEGLKKDLSAWEKSFLKDAEKMFHEETGKLINETSLKLKGYALARVKNYFPIRTDSHFTQQEWAGLVQNASLEGMGMLKERVISTKPILLEDITNVIQRQIRSVSKYAGLAVPVRNFETVMKQTSRDDNGQLHNLYETIDSVWGSSDTKWLKNLMQDIQGGRSEGGSPLMRLRGQFAGATLTLNPSVAIKQAASYPTAAAVVGWKPLGKAITKMGKGFITQEGIKELEDINPLLWYRNQGNATQELADAKAVGFGKNLPLWAQRAINWTQWFDTGTVRTLEYAAKYYVDDHFKLKEGTEEYWQKVSEVFTNIVEQTQPNYSTLHKADIIRNPNSFVKMLVMFKTQPMQNFGIIYDAMGELNAAKISGNKKWVNEASSKAAMAISSQAVSATVFSAMTILSQLLLHRWWKYRDDDEWSWEKFWVAFGEGALSCLTGAFIGGSELYEALKYIFSKVNDQKVTYYGIEVAVAEMVTDFVENTGNVLKNGKALWNAETIADKEVAAQNLLKSSINLGSTIGEFRGTPVNNIKNMLSSMYFYATDIIRSIDEGELSFSDDSNIATWDIKTQYERIYEALQNGDNEKYNKLVQELVNKTKEENPDATDDEITEKVEKDVIDKITNLMKTDYLEGNISHEEMMDYLVDEKGKTEEDAFFTVRGWETGESKYGVMTNDIDTAASDPTPENRQAVVEEINLLLEHGVEKSDISKKITTTYKSQYIELYNQGKAADLNSILRSALVAAGYTDDEAKKKIEGWLK